MQQRLKGLNSCFYSYPLIRLFGSLRKEKKLDEYNYTILDIFCVCDNQILILLISEINMNVFITNILKRFW